MQRRAPSFIEHSVPSAGPSCPAGFVLDLGGGASMLTRLAAATGRSQMPITRSLMQQAQHLDHQVSQILAQQGHTLQGGIAALQELTAALQLVLPLEYAEGTAHFKWAAALEASGGGADAEVPTVPLRWCTHKLLMLLRCWLKSEPMLRC